ncbi:glycosyltransferase [Dyella monticola]|uniref:Glycosyltransferase n=1 Tax=Dyella monticola TaxID=1927958 RepID=A0A370X8G8_9GAMM|nr:glycosyltransferase [Dyella monticola]RDS84525.1 glycosyltransferase [Dyella monticola]
MTEFISVVIPTYRNWTGAYTLAEALGRQVLPAETELDVVIVDDGSGEIPPETVKDLKYVQLLQLEKNIGRAGARNAGSRASKGQYLFFIDCDCLPSDNKFLASHMHALRHNAVGSTGHVLGVGGGFWDKYQRLASLRRQKQHRQGHVWVGSTQNLAVARSAFEQAGEFNASYRHYGFEDREFLIRLSSIGAIAWPLEASVLHNDAVHLTSIVEKMIQAAALSARTFSSHHMKEYRTLGYARIDARLHTWLYLPARLLAPFIKPAARMLDNTLPRLPFFLAYSLVKLITAGAFLYGSTLEQTDNGDEQQARP